MRRLFIISFILICVIGILEARPNWLPKDGNGVYMQMFRSYSTSADTVVTTASDSIAVPANAVECEMYVKDQIVYMRNRATTTPAATSWIQIPAGATRIFPVTENTHVCYKAITGTAKVYFIWRKL